MGIRRTKLEKQTAQLKRLEQLEYHFEDQPVSRVATKPKSVKTTDLLHFDTTLIRRDLGKTFMASIVVIMVLVALYFWL